MNIIKKIDKVDVQIYGVPLDDTISDNRINKFDVS